MPRKRLASAPDVPTAAELSYPSHDAVTWFSIMTRKGTPLGTMLESGSPRDLDARVTADTRRYGEVIRKANIAVDR